MVHSARICMQRVPGLLSSTCNNEQRMVVSVRHNPQAWKLEWARKPGVYFERELSRIDRDSDDNPQPSFLDRARTRRPRAICHRHASTVTCSSRLVVQVTYLPMLDGHLQDLLRYHPIAVLIWPNFSLQLASSQS